MAMSTYHGPIRVQRMTEDGELIGEPIETIGTITADFEPLTEDDAADSTDPNPIEVHGFEPCWFPES